MKKAQDEFRYFRYPYEEACAEVDRLRTAAGSDKRFHAAVAALQGLIAGAQPWGWTDEERALASTVFGERAVEYADKLLAALAEGEKP